jgi:two-component system, OmpR family, sensor histidine kinase TctE
VKLDDAPLLNREAVQEPGVAPQGLQPPSLFSEILDWMLAPLLVIWPISIATTYVVAASVANTPFDRALEERTISLGQQVQLETDPPRLSLPSSTRKLLRTDASEHVYLQVRGPHGELIGGDADLPPPSDDEPASTGLVQFRNLMFKGEEVRIAYLEIEGTDSHDQRALVQVAETMGKRGQLADEIIKGVILPQLVILPVAVILIWFGLSRGVRPLSRLQRRIAARAPGDMRPIDPHETPVEVAPLVLSFNQLLLRLESNISEQKRFIADAAHQMRTPLAGLRTQAELAMRETDPEELKRGLTQLARSSVRATRLVNQLLALARAETRADGSNGFLLLDLEGLAREVTRELVPNALDKHIDLGLEAMGEAVMVLGHPVLLREMLKNLIDNALRYTPEHGAVTVRIVADRPARIARLEVEDDGPGIAPEERTLVFERFYRILGNGTDGSGLGLAIVRETAHQHGASVTLRAASGVAGHDRPGTLATVAFRLQDGLVDQEKL